MTWFHRADDTVQRYRRRGVLTTVPSKSASKAPPGQSGRSAGKSSDGPWLSLMSNK